MKHEKVRILQHTKTKKTIARRFPKLVSRHAMSMTIPASKPIRFLRDRRSTRYQVDTADR